MASFNKQNNLLLFLERSGSVSESKMNVTEKDIYTATTKGMAYDDMMRTSYMFENADARRKRKWKEVRHIFMIMSQPQYKNNNLENALWFYGQNSGMDVDQFVMAVVNEYQFEYLLHMDRHLKYLYWACEGGVRNLVDWREIVASFKIFSFYKLIKYKPKDLLLHMFDIYANGNGRPSDNPSDAWTIKKPLEVFSAIFTNPCEDSGEVAMMQEYVEESYASFLKIIPPGTPPGTNIEEMYDKKFSRANFKQFLKHSNKLVSYYSKLAWARLSTDLRLDALEFEQATSLVNLDNYIQKYLLSQAIRIYKTNLMKFQFLYWKMIMLIGRKVRMHAARRLNRLKKVFFKFWRMDARKLITKRKRRLLAEVIGNYSLLSRAFARIRLFNYNNRRLTSIIGSFDKFAARFQLGAAQVREFRRLCTLRHGFYTWWNETKYMHDNEIAESHDWIRRVKKLHQGWFKYAHFAAMNRRNEALVLENKDKFDKMMASAESDIAALVELEKERERRIEEAKQKKRQEEKEKQLEASKLRLQKLREEDKQLILKMQADSRRRRIKKELKALKTKFDKKWDAIKEERIRKALENTKAYMANKDNKIAMQSKFERLKKEFYAAPVPEKADREKILTSPKNIVFLYLDAKLKNERLDISKVISKFDKEGKGNLTHDEFQVCIQSLKIPQLNVALISEVIRGVDDDNDGFISLEELIKSMKDIESPYMGVRGSPWKMYVDVAQDVICYHNFQTSERIFEYAMTDEKLQEILRVNMLCESENSAVDAWQVEKDEAWQVILQDKMARRMQYMYRKFKGRRVREQKMWKIRGREMNNIQIAKAKVVRWIEKTFVGIRSREKFARQLRLVYEKCWDVDSQRLFYMCHQTKVASWERPKLLWRYGDVFMPCPWIPFDTPYETQSKDQMFKISYWHVKAKKEFPRKPDGYPLCSHCQRNLSLARCLDCALEFCSPCLNATHCNWCGFNQATVPTVEQMMDQSFVERMNMFNHKFVQSVPFKCDSCKSDKVLAGLRCRQCKLDLCRPCCRRIHEQKAQSKHELWDI